MLVRSEVPTLLVRRVQDSGRENHLRDMKSLYKMGINVIPSSTGELSLPDFRKQPQVSRYGEVSWCLRSFLTLGRLEPHILGENTWTNPTNSDHCWMAELTVFRLGNHTVNLYLPLESWVGGRYKTRPICFQKYPSNKIKVSPFLGGKTLQLKKNPHIFRAEHQPNLKRPPDLNSLIDKITPRIARKKIFSHPWA